VKTKLISNKFLGKHHASVRLVNFAACSTKRWRCVWRRRCPYLHRFRRLRAVRCKWDAQQGKLDTFSSPLHAERL